MPIPSRFLRRRVPFLLLGVLLLTGLAACDSGDPDDDLDGTPLSDVIAAVAVGGTDASVVNDPFPDADGGAAPGVSGGDEIVRGGSLLLTVEVPGGADRLLVGLDGDYDGYYSAAIPSAGENASPKAGAGASSAANGGAQAVTVVVTSEADSDVGAFTLLLATETDGEVSEPAEFAVTVNTQAGTSGQLQVSLNWDAAVDLDLHLETPNEEDIYYGNPIGENGGELDLDSNAGCSLDRVDNENITWGDTTPPSGEYVVRVDLWSACDVTSPIPFVVTVNRGGTISTYTGTFQPDEADNGGAFDGRVITEFTL